MHAERSEAPGPVESPRHSSFANYFPWIAYGLALVARLAPVLLTRDLGIGLDDMFQYDMLGRSLATGNGFRWYAPGDLSMMLDALERFAGVDTSEVSIPQDPRGIVTSFRAPLYPLTLALVYAVAGFEARFLAARTVQAFLMASLAPMTYFLALRLGASLRWARLAALIPAFWPLLLVFPLALATENLFLPLLLGGTLALMKAGASTRARDSAFAGFLLGLAALTRSVIAGFPFLVFVWLWRRGARRSAALLLGTFLIVIFPWSLRNSLLHGRPAFIESSLGYNLYLGYHPEGDGSFLFGPSLDLVTILDDAERDAEGRRLAWQFVRQDPTRVPVLVLSKLGHFWGLEDRAFTFFYSNGLLGSLPAWAVVTLYLVLVLPLVLFLPPALLGWSSGLRSDGGSPPSREWWVLSLLLMWYVGIHLLIMAEERFHLALVPVLAAFAARGLTVLPSLQDGIRRREPEAMRTTALVVALALLALVNWGFELSANAERLAVLFGPTGSSAGFSY